MLALKFGWIDIARFNIPFEVYVKCHFVYLEINPLMVTDDVIMPLDVAAKIDETAAFLAEPLWHGVSFPPPFGRAAYPEEKFIQDMDAKTGASLKLTVLNPHGTVPRCSQPLLTPESPICQSIQIKIFAILFQDISCFGCTGNDFFS